MNHSNQQDNLRIIACPHILSLEKGRIDVSRPAGGNVNDLLRSIAWTPDSLHARVFIDGVYVKDAVWETTFPGPGQSVNVRAIPMGGAMGGGENQGKDAARMVAMIGVLALAIAAPYLAPVLLAGWVGVAATAAISIVGSLAVTAQIPPALPRLCDQRTESICTSPV
ncbi:MAG: hypothetical protein ABIU05_07385 [Nitrospirales bacterium]